MSILDPMVAEALLSMGKENLPNNTKYGDGAEIEPAALDELRAAYEAETVVIPWQEGQIMMLDNMLVAHGRRHTRRIGRLWSGWLSRAPDLGVKGDSFGAYIGGHRIEPGCGGPGAIERSPIRITNLRRAFTRARLPTVEMTFMSVELRKLSRIELIVIDL